MTKQTDCEIARTEAARSTVARLGADCLRQTLGRQVLCPDEELAPALGRNVDTRPETVPGSPIRPPPWRDDRCSDEAAGAGSMRGNDCLDGTGAICRRLAEARTGKALADRQLIELTHRLANMLQGLVTRIERQRRMPDSPTVQDELDRLLTSVCALAQLHRYLLPSRNLMHVELGAFFSNLAAAVEGVTGLRCDVEADAVTVPGQVATYLAAAVSELAWNAYKHAYDSVEGRGIRIVCRRDTDARLLISVADQGRGLPAGFDPSASKGIGLMVVYSTAQQFGGQVRLESDRGARITLLLPIAACEGDTL